MRRRRLPLGVLVPAGTLVLVCTLAVLQYRWLGQVSDAEAERLRVSLDLTASEFTSDFDQEVSSIYLALQAVDGTALIEGDASDFSRRLDRWRESTEFADLVDQVYLATAAGADAETTLARYDAEERAFVSTEWPERLEPVREQLAPAVPNERLPILETPGESPRTIQVFEVRQTPMMPDVPAVIVPIAHEATFTSASGSPQPRLPTDVDGLFVGLGRNRNVFVVSLDPAYLRQTLLYEVARRHFSRQSSDLYEFSVVDRQAEMVLTSLPGGDVIPSDRADISVPFFGLRYNRFVSGQPGSSGHLMAWTLTQADGTRARAERIDLSTDISRNVSVVVGEAPAGEAVESAGVAFGTTSVRVRPTGWQLRVQHADGSLEAAVANARTRNLWLSFGMLALLLASVGLVVVNAQRSERLAARQMDFVATVSHELRTPLAVIRSAAQNLQAGVVLEHDQARRYGDLIEGEGRRLTDMIEQVLEYAGLSGNRHAIRTRPVDVRSVVDEVLETCGSLLDGERFEVSTSVPADLPAALADHDALRRALENLVTNALKYAADGRWIGITAESGAAHGRHEIRVSVADKGRGIDAEDLPHIFEPFYRGRYARDRQIGGNGLGLSLVKRIAETHGGRLSVRSAAGQGTTFTMHLPVAQGDPATHRLADANQPV